VTDSVNVPQRPADKIELLTDSVGVPRRLLINGEEIPFYGQVEVTFDRFHLALVKLSLKGTFTIREDREDW